MELRERFFARTEPGPGGCIDWTGTVRTDKWGNRRGYVNWVALPSSIASRCAYWLEHGDPLPEEVRHTCDRSICVNPDHLVGGTHADNMRDMRERGRHWAHGRTHCTNGHEYDLYGVRFGTRGDGSRFRICLECERIRTHKKRKPGKRGPARRERWG